MSYQVAAPQPRPGPFGSPVRSAPSEVRRLLALAAPVSASQLSTMLMGLVDTVMVGHVGVDTLAAAALGNLWAFATLMVVTGIIMGLDPIVAQAHGARDGARAGLTLQRGIALALCLSVPVALLWLGTESFLQLAGQDPRLSRMAYEYTLVQIPSIPFFLAYTALRQYLQGREFMRPAMWVILIANLFNVLFNWVLIFGHLGFPALGLLGAGIATGLTRITSFIGLALWVRAFGLHRGAWIPWSWAALDRRELRRVAAIGLPIAIQMSLEVWAFGAAGLLAGRLGAVPLAAHTIVITMVSFSYMVPMGISQGAMTRVGNLVGAREPDRAQRASWIALGIGAGVMTLSACAFVLLRGQLPRIFTPDPTVIALAASILPIAAAFQIFDGTQVVGGGVLRAVGRTRPAAVFNLIGYWLLGLPVGGWLALHEDLGLAGIWWGLCVGLTAVAVLFTLWIRFRGPATHRNPNV